MPLITSKESLETNLKRLPLIFRKDYLFYYLLAGLRVFLTCIPQSGYVHPDEYFQSIEVVAGDVFDVDFIQPWEYNRTFPIRSIVVPYMTVGLSYRFLHLVEHVFGLALKTPYFLTVFPRLFMCFISFSVDYSMYKICRINNEYPRYKLLILASSYVMLVYGTRTFSNTVEMVLLSILLCLVAECQAYSHNVIQQNEYLTDRYRKATAAVDRARIYKLKISLPPHSMRHSVYVSIITVIGVFNRPTFIAFAFPPVFFWFHRGIGCKSVSFAEFHCRMLLFLLWSSLTIAIFVIVDSFYFGYISMAEIQQLEISMNNFIVTPVNFIRYNMDVKELAEHGLHPRFLHILVNVPLLYNIVGVVAVGSIAVLACRLVMGYYTSLPRIHSVRGLMTTAMVAPVAGLSYFPHQEPRFLIPITLPIILLYGGYIVRKPALLKLWFLINVLCLLFYGFVHQAGIYPATAHLARDLATQRIDYNRVPFHVVTSHVYNLPMSLLQQRNTHKLYSTGKTRYKLPKTLLLQEMGSKSLHLVLKRLSAIVQMQYQLTGSRVPKSNIYLLLPTSKWYQLDALLNDKSLHHNLTVTNINTFYPHISTEALPDFLHCLSYSFPEFSVFNFLSSLIKSCGLGLYEVQKINCNSV